VTACRLVVHYPFFPFFPAKYSNVTGPPQHREMRNDLGMCFLPKSPVSGYVAFFFSWSAVVVFSGKKYTQIHKIFFVKQENFFVVNIMELIYLKLFQRLISITIPWIFFSFFCNFFFPKQAPVGWEILSSFRITPDRCAVIMFRCS